jgi:hypothetical protein
MVREVGLVTIAMFSWHHRGSLIRSVDLLLRLPVLLRTGRTADALTEATAISALDRDAPTDTDIRITGVHQGDLVLRGDLSPDALDVARTTLLGVRRVVEVRSDGSQQPSLDDDLAPARA